MMDVYALKLVEKWGEGILEELNKLKKPYQMKRRDYEEILEDYKDYK